jgi:hypothetical protein
MFIVVIVLLVTGHKKGCSKTKHFNYKGCHEDKQQMKKSSIRSCSPGRPEDRSRKARDEVKTAHPLATSKFK